MLFYLKASAIYVPRGHRLDEFWFGVAWLSSVHLDSGLFPMWMWIVDHKDFPSCSVLMSSFFNVHFSPDPLHLLKSAFPHSQHFRLMTRVLHSNLKNLPVCFRIICGLTQFTNKCHIAFAALEAVCFQTREVIIMAFFFLHFIHFYHFQTNDILMLKIY